MKKALLLILTLFITLSVTGQPPDLVTRMNELIKPKKPEKESEFTGSRRTLEILQLQSPGWPPTSRLKSQQDYKKQLDSVYIETEKLHTFKEIFFYDNNDRFIREIFYQWDPHEEEWISYLKHEYFYDAAGNLEKELSSYWDEDWNDWILEYQTEIFFDDDRYISSVIYSEHYDGTFMPYLKHKFFFEEGNLVEQIEYDYYNPDTGEWDQTWRFKFVYENGLMIQETKYEWDYIDEKWVSFFHFTFHYDDGGNLDEKLIYYGYDEDLGTFDHLQKFKYEYDDQGYPIEVVNSTFQADEWYPTNKQVSEYDHNYNLIEKSIYYLLFDEWIPSTRYEFSFNYSFKYEEALIPYDFYDDSFTNMLTEISIFKDFNNDSIIDRQKLTLYYSDYEPSEVPDPDTYTLTIDFVGNGTVEVNGEPYTSAVTVDEGTELNLEAITDEGWEFEGWTGDLTSTSATETITMNSNMNITATFSEVAVEQYTLTVTIAGNGAVEVNGEPYTAAVTVDEGTELNLEAIADEGWEFEGWTGDPTSTSATETITMNSDMNITATFILVSSAERMFPGELEIFPNPFSTSITLNNIQDYSRLIIANIIGKTVKYIQITGHESITIPTDDLDIGIYLFILQAEGGERIVRKMVKD